MTTGTTDQLSEQEQAWSTLEEFAYSDCAPERPESFTDWRK